MNVYKVVDPETRRILASYLAESPASLEGGPLEGKAHLLVPGGTDPDCVKVELVEGVLSLVVDSELASEKKIKRDTVLIGESYNRMDTEVYAEMKRVYGTSKSDSATAFYLTWQDMLVSPSTYVNPSLGLNSEAEVTAYATLKLSAARTYAAWRMARIAQFEAERAAILAGG